MFCFFIRRVKVNFLLFCDRRAIEIVVFLLRLVMLFFVIGLVISIRHHITFLKTTHQAAPPIQADIELVSRASSEQDLQLVMQQNWFGKTVDEDKSKVFPVQVNNDDKGSSIVLHGVLLGAQSSAIIEENGEQHAYSLGESLLFHDAFVEALFLDYILLNHQGDLVRLSITDEEKTTNEYQRINAKIIPPMSFVNQVLFNELPLIVQENLAKNPQEFFNYIHFTPMYQNGVAGYVLSSGSDSSLFDACGLNDGDIAISINDQAFSGSNSIDKFMRQIYSESKVSIAFLRGGIRHDTSIYLR